MISVENEIVVLAENEIVVVGYRFFVTKTGFFSIAAMLCYVCSIMKPMKMYTLLKYSNILDKCLHKKLFFQHQ